MASASVVPAVFHSSLFIPDLGPRKKESALHLMVARAHAAAAVREPELLQETLWLRERVGSTALGKGVALPNARSLCVIEPRIVLARSRRGIDWCAPDETPVRLVLMVLSPSESGENAHLDFLSRAVAAVRNARSRQKLVDETRFEAISALLREVCP